MYAHLETVNSWVYLPLKPEEVTKFKECAGRCLDNIQAKEYTREEWPWLPASKWYVRTAKLVVSLPGAVEWREGAGFVCCHGHGYGTPVLERQDGYAPHGAKSGKSAVSAA